MTDQKADQQAGTGYMFAGNPDDLELQRLQTQERAYDWASRGKLAELGVGPGSWVLEAGAGAGSMLAWMAEQAGPNGHVVGIDLDDRFFARNEGPNTTVRRDDLRTAELGEACFNAVHARLLFLHLTPTERTAVLERFVRALRPGGWIVALDPDLRLRFPSADERTTALQGRLLDAFLEAVGTRADYTIGSRLPDLFAAAGLQQIESMAVLPRFTAPQRNAAFGTVHARALRNTYLAVRGVVEAAGLLSTPDLDEFFARFDAGEVGYNFPAFLTWGQRPA